MPTRSFIAAILGCLISLTSTGLLANGRLLPTQRSDDQPAAWLGDYNHAIRQAEAQQKLGLLWFVAERWAEADDKFDRFVLQNSEIARRIESRFISCRLPVETTLSGN